VCVSHTRVRAFTYVYIHTVCDRFENFSSVYLSCISVTKWYPKRLKQVCEIHVVLQISRFCIFVRFVVLNESASDCGN